MNRVKVLSNPLNSASRADYSWSFALNMVPQYRGTGPWRDYLYGERFYIILSFVAKTILSWIVFVGIFTPLPTFLLKTRKKERDYCEGEKATAPASKPDGVRGFNSRPRYPLRR